MKTCILLFVVCFSAFTGRSQRVLISGKEGLRPLVWSDFRGKVPGNATFQAMTYWKVASRFDRVRFEGNKALFDGLAVTLELDSAGSWHKPAFATEALLKHEQGHFDIGVLCMREMLKRLTDGSFTKANLQARFPMITQMVLEKYKAMQLRYDEETDHSKNVKAQTRWNLSLQSQLTATAPTVQ